MDCEIGDDFDQNRDPRAEMVYDDGGGRQDGRDREQDHAEVGSRDPDLHLLEEVFLNGVH
ncbi:unnamed protein product [Arabis nemorensis]|uniref:Uncharacterized protein n=1 Tax=Arabis nemorensis TaxID=586526 RepID=A0A565AUK2_9BRAS|nr:unnamed protein product [Arabis nemorensis]